jgi:Type IV secretion system pilin
MKILHKIIQMVRNYSFVNFRYIYLSGLVWLLNSETALATTTSGSSSGSGVSLINPLTFTTAEGLLTAILEVVIILATPFIVFFIIYAGFLYVTARGNAEQITQANRALTYAIIGGVIIIGSVAIATIVKNIVSAF